MISGTSTANTSTAITTGDNSCVNCASATAAAGIAVAATLLVALPVGVVIGCCGMWCLMRSPGTMSITVPGDREKEELAGAIYDEPAAPTAPVETAFSLSDNQAYGKVSTQQRS